VAREDRPDTCATYGLQECLDLAQNGWAVWYLRDDTDLHVVDEKCCAMRLYQFLKRGKYLDAILGCHGFIAFFGELHYCSW